MKKSFNVAFYTLLNIIFLFLVGIFVVSAQEAQPLVDHFTFLPGIFKAPPGHVISGKVVSPQNVAVQGVKVQTNKGQVAYTDQNGHYSITNLGDGTYTVTPSLAGATFSPTSSVVVVPPDVSNLNFTAEVLCTEAIVNGGFESNTGWTIPETDYPAGYSTTQVRTGSRSMRTGIYTAADNTYSYSGINQKVVIPAGTSSAQLSFWLKSYSTGLSGNLSLPSQPEAGTKFGTVQMSGDVQYVLVLDSNFNIIENLIWHLSNNQAWTEYTFNLAKYAGKTIYLHFGTYNDGLNGVASMFVDDVSLQICPGGSPTPSPTPGNCTNLLDNPGFETVSDWEIPQTAYPAGYSSAQKHSGSWSMRTGILKTADNTYSYSDFRQAVTIPAGTTKATARFWLYMLSGEAMNLSAPESITPTGKPFSDTVLSGDLQYVLVLDHDKNWIDTLVWQRSDQGYWHYFEFDLRRYAGSTIYLQFGTYNDGYSGITSMFVDDTSLDNCSTTPTPSPTPTRTPTATPTLTPTPGGCQELIANNDFSGNTGWVIPVTNYPAGYSNTQYHSAFRSMRTGIVNSGDNLESYSDFRQAVTIPSTAGHVTLTMWLLPFSSGTENLSQPTVVEATGKPFTDTVLSDDTQYTLILDENQNWIGTLVWQRSNSQTWTKLTFDLSGYKGTKIYLQWGTFNNGTSGITSMYVDDVSLQVCP